MSINLRYPDFNRAGQADGYRWLQSYLRQLVDELNIALAQVEGTASQAQVIATSSANAEKNTVESPKTTFNAIKSLIIKSADIVDAYYDTISKRLEGMYVAQSAFGTYTEETAQSIEANSAQIKQIFESMQTILADIESVEHTLIEVNAHIKSGVLYYDEAGVPVYGLEIGQRTEIDGEETFNKYARFTSDKLSFYDSNDNEVAYISDKKLYITHVEITGSFKLGGFRDTAMADGSVVTQWIEGSW